MADPKKTATRARRSPKAADPKGAGASVVAPSKGAAPVKGAAPARSAAKRAPKAAAKAAATPPTLAAKVQEVVETTREAPAQLALRVPPAVETPAAAAMKAIEGAVEAAKPLEAAVPAPVAAAVETVRTVLGAAPKADEIVAPAARLVESAAERARSAYARAQATGDHLRQAMSETAAASTRGALEVNGKVIDALVAQSDAAFDVWRRSLAAGSIAEAMRLQTSGAREVYETASSHWRDVAETATRWLGSTIRPIQAAAEQTRRG
jgi:hypothetical protein